LFGKWLAILALILSFSFLFMGSTEALAAAHGGGGHGKPAPLSTDVFSLDVLNSTDGVAHWGQQVTFTVSTTATTEPHVSLRCSQNGVLVYATQTGYYAGYLWPWTQVMTLSSVAWSGGSADCVATLYYFSGASVVSLGTLSFSAYP
jgi:hypothetical protein